MSSEQETFSGFRRIFWPVHAYEAKKVLPMALMMFCILFTYTILRDVKDSLVVTNCGAEAIVFLKIYGTLPFAILLVSIYAKLSTVLTRPQLFNISILSFTIFFLVFGFIIFPLRDTLHASPETLAEWQSAYPRLKFLIAIVGNWSYALLYIFAELWGTIGLSILFWQFANEITKICEAKRFYPLFGLIGNVGFLFSGFLLISVTDHFKALPPMERWEASLQWIITAVTISSGLTLYLYRWVRAHVMTDSRLYDPKESNCTKKKKKTKMSFKASLQTVFGSRYLMLMALLVLSYGITINLVEVTWKTQMKLQFPSESEYAHAMGYFSMVSALATIVLMVIGANILRHLGWFVGAMITPIIMLLTGATFFAFIIFQDQMSPWLISLGTTPLFMAVLIGGAQNILTKSSKYALFDATKEMAYIPLSRELKTQGKAAVDGLGDRLGKSGGGIIQQILLMSIAGATQLSIAPYVAIIFVAAMVIWLFSVEGLHKAFRKHSDTSV